MVPLDWLMAVSNIAIVVPVLNDAPAVTALIERIRSWADQPGDVVIVAAEPDRQLRTLCTARNCRLIESIRNRGYQLDMGARACSSLVLWFLHADAEPYASSLGVIASAIAEGAEGGYFRFRFLGPPSWRKTLLAGLTNLRVRLGGIPYGDQGLFVRRKVYDACGGFAHQPLFEEVALVKKLRARGHFRGIGLPIGVATRRWDRDGWWHRSFANRRLALRYMLGASAESLAVGYDRSSVTDEDLGN